MVCAPLQLTQTGGEHLDWSISLKDAPRSLETKVLCMVVLLTPGALDDGSTGFLRLDFNTYVT